MKHTKAEELAADCNNKITYAITLLNAVVENKKQPSEKELKMALQGLREAVKNLTKMSRL